MPPTTDIPVPRTSVERADMPTLGGSEWVLTNGLGGFAMGSASGIPARRYHAWLVAALAPPVGRVVGLHSCVEWLVLDPAPGSKAEETRIDLSSLRYADGTLSPRGIDALERFELIAGVSATWTSRVSGSALPGRGAGDIVVTRSLVVPRDKNAVVVRYTVRREGGGGVAGRLDIRPLAALRDFHVLRPELDASVRFDVRRIPGDNGCVVATDVAHVGPAALTVSAWGTGGRCTFRSDEERWRSVFSEKDKARGQDHVETLFSPGWIALPLGAGETKLEVRAHVGGTEHQPDGHDTEVVRLQSRRDARAGDVLRSCRPGTPPRDRAALAALACAADQFIVRRRPPAAVGPAAGELSTVIAGYPWFSDWGRDSFIAMPGLFLCAGRDGEAFDTLVAFASLAKDGLVPNCFDDGSGRAWYNTVDASLWFVHAACAYLRRTGDRSGFEHAVLPACEAIVAKYRDGTRYGIRADPADGLIAAGDPTTQLTWMDAKRDGVVFTPRHGKAVEINALWYSALLELAGAVGPGDPRAAEWRSTAERVGASFRRLFWNDRRRCLFDVLTPTAAGAWTPIDDLRPNQTFAVSLPHSPLDPAQQRAVVAAVREHLLTPEGLRTLDRGSPRYRPRFEGDLMSRDGAYHNGTVWPWLIGPFCSAVLRVSGDPGSVEGAAARDDVRAILEPLICELIGPRSRPGPLLTLTEVYDGDEPRRADGCMAQAWSVAEVLRVLHGLWAAE